MPTTQNTAVPAHPFAEGRFSPLVEAFRHLYQRPEDGGGALAIYLRGQPQVDIWAGYADTAARTPWRADTMAVSFSTSKGVASTVVHRLVAKGVLDPAEPVATWWPAFAAKGKDRITLAEVMSHRAGLHRVRGIADSPADLLDHRRMADLLAARAPDATRGKPAYHAMTYGYLIAAIVEHATGRDFVDVLDEEVRRPLDLPGLYIGTPASQHHRIAPFFERLAPFGLDLAQIGHWVKKVQRFRPFVDALLPHGFDAYTNTPELWAAVIPAANGVFDARSLAKMYGALANQGSVDGVSFLDPALVDAAGRVQTRARDRVLGLRMRWRLGYHQAFVTGEARPRQGFGHFGLGGSGGWADPETGLALGFVTNKLGSATTPIADARLARLGGIALECLRR